MTSTTSYDPDVIAAFGGGSTPSVSTANASYDPDVAAAFGLGSGQSPNPTPAQLRAASAAAAARGPPIWNGPREPGIQSTTPVGYGLSLAGQGLAKGANYLGVTDPNSLRDISNLPGAISTVMGGKIAGNALRSVPEEATPTSSFGADTLSAARATPNITNASPELQDAITSAAQKGGGAVNPDALTRHLEADSLPVPVQLTRGQATQDPSVLSFEQNRRGAIPELASRFNEQNGQLVQNLQTLRDQVGPEVFSTNPVEHGDTLIKAYEDKDSAVQADINQKYKAFADSTGGTIDQSGLLGNLENTFRQQKIWNQDGTQKVMKSLSDISENPNMTAGELEAYQTSLARTIRSTSDGHEAYAAGLAKQALYDTPIADEATAQQQQLGIAARQAAKARFDAMDADPAYKAAVNGTVPPDKFVQKFITGPSATRDGVATMRTNLAGHDTAQQTMSVAALDHLGTQAGVTNGNFTQAGYNKALQAMGPKMPSLFDPKTTDTLQTLGNVARYTQAQPRGAFVNNSNTATAAAAEFGKNALEGMVNVKFGGIPVGTIGRKYLQGRAAKAFARDSLAPGAGLTDLTGNP